MVLSLPFFVATAKKLQAVGWLLAEMRVSEELAGTHTAAIRGLVAAVVPIAGSAALGLFALVLSSTLLPSPKVLAVLLVAIALAGWFLSRSFSKVYTSAQAALLETFAVPADPVAPPAATTPLLAEADLATVTVAAGSHAAGRLIRELALRTRTGTSIVALERAGHRQINPGPDEELHAGDQVLLLGHPEQLATARAWFAPRT